MNIRSYLQGLSHSKILRFSYDEEDEGYDPFAPLKEDDDDYLGQLSEQDKVWLQQNMPGAQPAPPAPETMPAPAPAPVADQVQEPVEQEPAPDYTGAQPGTPEHREAVFTMQDATWSHATHDPSPQLMAFDRLPGNQEVFDDWASRIAAKDQSGVMTPEVAAMKIQKSMIKQLGTPKARQHQSGQQGKGFVDQRMRFFRGLGNEILIPGDVRTALYQRGIAAKNRADMTEEEIASGLRPISDANETGRLEPVEEIDPETNESLSVLRLYYRDKGGTLRKLTPDDKLTDRKLGKHPDNKNQKVWLASDPSIGDIGELGSEWRLWTTRGARDPEVKNIVDDVFTENQDALLAVMSDLIYGSYPDPDPSRANDKSQPGVRSSKRIFDWIASEVRRTKLDKADIAHRGLEYGTGEGRSQEIGEAGGLHGADILIREEEMNAALDTLSNPDSSLGQVASAAKVMDQLGEQIPDDVIGSLEGNFGKGQVEKLLLGLTKISDKDSGKSTIEVMQQPVYQMLGNISALAQEVSDMMRVIAPRKMQYDQALGRPKAEDGFFRLHARADLMEAANDFSINMAEQLLGSDPARVKHILDIIEKARKKKSDAFKVTHPDMPRLSLEFTGFKPGEGFDPQDLTVGNYSTLLSYGPGLTEFIRNYIDSKDQSIRLMRQGSPVSDVAAQTGLSIPEVERTAEMGPQLIRQLQSQAFAQGDMGKPTSLSTNMSFWTPDIVPSVVSVMVKDAIDNGDNRKYPPETRRAMMNMFGTLGGYKDPATANFYGQGFSENAIWGEGAGVRNYQLYLKVMAEIMGDLPDQSGKPRKKQIDPEGWDRMLQSPAPSRQLGDWGAMPSWGDDPEKFWRELSTNIMNIRKHAGRQIQKISQVRDRMKSLHHSQSSVSYLNYMIKNVADQASAEIRSIIQIYAN